MQAIEERGDNQHGSSNLDGNVILNTDTSERATDDQCTDLFRMWYTYAIYILSTTCGLPPAAASRLSRTQEGVLLLECSNTSEYSSGELVQTAGKAQSLQLFESDIDYLSFGLEDAGEVLFVMGRSFTEALQCLSLHPKMRKDFYLTEQTMKHIHGHAMHFVTQYLRIHSSRQKPLFASCQTLMNQPAHQLLVKNNLTSYLHSGQESILLERLTLQSAVLSLVLKVHFQDYVLELMPALEQFQLFDDKSKEFQDCYRTFFGQPRNNLIRNATGVSMQHSQAAQLPNQLQSQFKTSINAPQFPSRSQDPLLGLPLLLEPDMRFLKVSYEERIKHALQYNLSFESPLVYIERFFTEYFTIAQLQNEEIAFWRKQTQETITNFCFLPFSLVYHPAMLAAAYLQWNKLNIQKRNQQIQHNIQIEQSDMATSWSRKTKIPEVLFDHPWYLYIDSEINYAHLEQLTAILTQEIDFVNHVLSPGYEESNSSSQEPSNDTDLPANAPQQNVTDSQIQTGPGHHLQQK